MNFLLENHRQIHENCEILIQLMSENVLVKESYQKQKMVAKYKMKFFMQKYQESRSALVDLYEDLKADKKKELNDLLSIENFYSQLQKCKKYHENNPEKVAEVPCTIRTRFEAEAKNYAYKELAKFTDEENYGEFVDLNQFYQIYLNIKGIDHEDYVEYLRTITDIFKIPEKYKTQKYVYYLQQLINYFEDFLQRSKPQELQIISESRSNIEDLVNEEISRKLSEIPEILVDLSGFADWQEMSSLGMETLKNLLKIRGKKTGGTLEERAKRLFAVKDVEAGRKLDRKEESRLRLECSLLYYVNMLSRIIFKTIDNIQSKQARCGSVEREDEEIVESSSDSEEDDLFSVPYNPKMLPLQSDGTPIPYWLYKLNGLQLSYSCEICGDFSYRGLRSFQRHFSEYRHCVGMRCLGIPNTSHFYYVTSIEAVMDLYERLMKQRTQEKWSADNEEFEDSFGNVLKRKTYMDLMRQGCV